MHDHFPWRRLQLALYISIGLTIVYIIYNITGFINQKSKKVSNLCGKLNCQDIACDITNVNKCAIFEEQVHCKQQCEYLCHHKDSVTIQYLSGNIAEERTNIYTCLYKNNNIKKQFLLKNKTSFVILILSILLLLSIYSISKISRKIHFFKKQSCPKRNCDIFTKNIE